MEITNDRKKMIQKGFNTVAPSYDHPSLFFFQETANKMVELINLNGSEHLLDLCAGTGAVSIPAAQQLSSGQVNAVDLSPGMLAQAKEKAEQRGLNNIQYLNMDIENMEFEPESMDVATISFGLFFLEDMTNGLNEIAKRVKPGGVIALSSFSGDAFSPMADMFIADYEATGRKVPPLSWKRLATPELIKEQFAAVGISDVEITHLPLGRKMDSADMWWDVVWNAGWRSLLNDFSETELAAFTESHMKKMHAFVGNEGVWFNTEVLIAVAKKP